LINRADTYPDLALPIDAAHERIFAAIDGRRSLDEILECRGSKWWPDLALYRAALAIRPDSIRRDCLNVWNWHKEPIDVTQRVVGLLG
jgi:hypothetical protein